MSDRRAETAPGWHRRVWRLAFPIILSNISVPLLGAVDTAVVGHLSAPYYLGAVAVGAMIFNFIYWGFGFLRMGTTGLTAQAQGANQPDEVRDTLARAMLIAVALAALLLVSQSGMALAAFAIVEASAEVERFGRVYFDIRILGAPAALVNYVFLGWFLGMQNARAALILQLWMNGLNIALDILFVMGFGWDVAGVALATVIAEYAAALLAFWLCARMLKDLGGRFSKDRILARRALYRMLSLNMDIFIRTVGLVFAFASFTAQGARMGDVMLAANAVLLNFVMFTAHGLDGFAHAIQALAGGAIGARDRSAFHGAVRVSTLWASIVAVGLTTVFGLFGLDIVNLLTGITEVRLTAMEFLPWVVIFPLVSVWAFQLDGIFVAATRGAAMRNAMLLSVAVYVAACWWLLPLWQNHGLWLGFTLFMAARGVTLAVRYPTLVRSVGN